jgi:glutamine synthetase
MTDLDNNFLDHQRLSDFLRDVPMPDDVYIAEYVWIGGNGDDMRCKARTLPGKPDFDKPEDLPVWNYDGSSTNQAPGHDSEVHIVPRAIYKDPFRGGNNILVLCDGFKKGMLCLEAKNMRYER